ncbi:MAG TPA: bifunctional phosphoglucose/phosphomannose isomerase [Candidatus Saccharimonadales bacterium]|nr:bifunctional phosphoglucose/phosphomannose isomerase [Candidatus Saccharimonadales bacterium]
MLDDLKYIHEKDAEDALGIAEKQWQYLNHHFETEVYVDGPVKNVVLAGMGGSALPAVFLGSWPRLSVPFEIVRDYTLPQYVGAETLFISSSYSGNTEETLSALDEAEKRGAHIVVITAGGTLADRAKAKGYPLFLLPSNIQPRMATFFFLAAFMQLFEPLGLVPAGSLDELHEAANWLKDQPQAWLPTVPSANNIAKRHALDIVGKTVIAYGGPKMWPAVNKWKITHNENAKNLAWSNQYPEFNHNEFIGWSSHPVDKPFAVVEIRSDLEHPRVQKRFEASERLLSGKRPTPIVVQPEGDTLLKQLLWASVLGDFVSLYVALLNGLNPSPVDLVEKLKKILAE